MQKSLVVVLVLSLGIFLGIIKMNQRPQNLDQDLQNLNVEMGPTVEPTEVRAEHILLDTKEEANKILLQIETGQISFEDAAKQFSKCPSAKDGGDLGFFKRGVMVKEFEDAAFSVNVGEISEPVQTEFGWHLIKVTERR